MEFGKTLAVLLALWGALAAIGYFGGAFPMETGVSSTRRDDDAGVAADAGVAGDAPAEGELPDAWVEPEDAGRVAALDVFGVCAAPDEVRWTLGDLFGDSAHELVVGCAGDVQLLAMSPQHPPTRVARFVPSEAASLRDAAIGDMDGDDRQDLALAMDSGLFLVSRDASGGFASARVLAPGRHGVLALGELDAAEGLDLAVIHGADPRAEIWLFHGGPTPLRGGTAPAPVETAALAVLDLDLDGHLDVLAVGPHQILLAFGDSRAGIARTRSMTPGGRSAVVLADANGRPFVVVERDGGACALQPTPGMDEAGECAPLPSLHPDARLLRASGEGLVGVRHPDVVGWTAAGTGTLATLSTTRFGLHRVLRGDGELVMLGSRVDASGARAIELARAPLYAALRDDEEPAEIEDAPLVLEVALPDPNAP